MKTIAIISEYNPFHLGHLHQINEIKKYFYNEDIIIVSIMSGNFIQRGEPSIINKFKRCESVLNSGINLCLEIPVHISLSSAEGFAYGAINILDKLNCIDYICFGCEIPDQSKLELIAETLISIDKSNLEKYLKHGVSFAKAQELLISEVFNDDDITKMISSPNNILAIEYIKSLKLLNSKIKILPIQRVGGGYNDNELNTSFSSATSIRKILNTQNDKSILSKHVPESTYKILNEPIVNKEQMFPYLKYKLLTNNSLNKIEGTNEGLYNKFYKEISHSSSLDELILNVKSKRYPYSRISRILCKYFIGFESFSKDEICSFNNYVRVLGFDKKGSSLLKLSKKKSSLNIITKFNHKNSHLSPLDILSTKAYSILNSKTHPLEDFHQSPIIKS